MVNITNITGDHLVFITLIICFTIAYLVFFIVSYKSETKYKYKKSDYISYYTKDGTIFIRPPKDGMYQHIKITSNIPIEKEIIGDINDIDDIDDDIKEFQTKKE